MASALLPNRAVIRVGGPDAFNLLQNIVTADLDTLHPGEAKPSALLTPQGKILFDFLISRDGDDALLLDVRTDVVDDLMRRLMLYRLRAKAEISKLEQVVVGVEWDIDSATSQNDSTHLRDLRFANREVWRVHAPALDANAGIESYDALRIAEGVAESGSDYELGDAFPHDVLLDQNGGVGFKKGCYVGQEVVSRMQHRGTARRRILIANADAALPASGTDVIANDRVIGKLGTVAGREALAMVRIDRVKDAIDAEMPVLAGSVPLLFTIPPGAKFTFPSNTDESA
ncbi:MAG: folate-binding protein YgfZ [Mesorhizobium sp.]